MPKYKSELQRILDAYKRKTGYTRLSAAQKAEALDNPTARKAILRDIKNQPKLRDKLLGEFADTFKKGKEAQIKELEAEADRLEKELKTANKKERKRKEKQMGNLLDKLKKAKKEKKGLANPEILLEEEYQRGGGTKLQPIQNRLGLTHFDNPWVSKIIETLEVFFTLNDLEEGFLDMEDWTTGEVIPYAFFRNWLTDKASKFFERLRAKIDWLGVGDSNTTAEFSWEILPTYSGPDKVLFTYFQFHANKQY